MKYIALIEGKDVSVIKWFKTKDEVDEFLATWLRDNRETRPYVRTTIAECIFTIEG
jgi:hypothetical protein